MVLVVDDEPDLSALLDQLLTKYDMRHEMSSGVDDAYARVAAHGELYTVAFVDLNMAGETLAGLRLISMIQNLSDPDKASLPIVLMTGSMQVRWAADEVSKRFLAGVLPKPFLPEEFEQAIRRHSRFAIESIRTESRE